LPKLTLVGENEMPGEPGESPVPLSGTVCGLPAASSATLTVADRAAATVGENVTLIVQFAPAASVEPQPFVCEKSPGFVPARLMLAILSVAVPVFVSTIACCGLEVPVFLAANARLVGENEATGDPAVPVPVRPVVCGLPAASSAILTDALREAATVGVNVTEILQLEPAATAAGQLFVCAKSPAFDPVMLIPEMLSVDVPVLLSVTELAVLVVLTT
jgi:hypothetical protein